MNNDDVSFESIKGSEDDQLDPNLANGSEDAIFSGADPDDASTTEDEEE